MGVTDDVKARLDIVDVISETVSLKKSGRNYIGFCPFHTNTKTPSFVVFPETQTWRCFGACADGGDLFNFVMKQQGLDFKETLQLLATQAGIALQSQTDTPEHDRQRQKLLELNASAAVYFHSLLTGSPAAKQTRAYLTNRKISTETIAAFQLGYALDEWEALKTHFIKRGYTAQELLEAGLLVERDNAPGYDRFRNRFIIPIRDTRGQVIGFGARALAQNQVPKYLNTPQTALFDKSAVLYGLDAAKRHIRQKDEVVIVEGYMDVIQAHQQGATNVVAQMGTALTEQQLKRLAPLATKIILALDADAAGSAATVRSLSVARQTLPQKPMATVTSKGTIAYEGHISQEIYIAPLPVGKDPDDVLKDGLDAWQILLDQAIPSLDFYENLVLKQPDLNTPQGKSLVVRELLPIYREIKDNIEKAARVQRLARKLGLDERLLMTELKGNQPQARKRQQSRVSPAPVLPPKETASPPASAGPLSLPTLEDYCLSLILTNSTSLAIANQILEEQGQSPLLINDFNRGDNKEIFKALQMWTAMETPTLDSLTKMVDPTLKEHLTTLVSQWQQRPPAPSENVNLDLCTTILRLRLKTIIEQINQLKSLLHTAETENNTENIRRYRETIAELSQQRRQLHITSDALTLTGRRRVEAQYYGAAV